MGFNQAQALGSIRITMGLQTTPTDIELTISALKKILTT
jgi:cysteine sulfinate desulfinase/cysteine desulfurase-like protein